MEKNAELKTSKCACAHSPSKQNESTKCIIQFKLELKYREEILKTLHN